MSVRCDERGLTFIEMLIAVTLVALVVAGFYGLLSVGIQGWVGLEGQLDVQQHPRVAAGRVLAEVRQARDFVIGSGGTALGLVKATLLTQDVASLATSFTVEDASVLASGVPLVLVNLNRVEQASVASIAGNTVTVSSGLTSPHLRGELVRRPPSTLAVAASTGATSLSVADGAPFRVGDPIAVEDELPLTVAAVAGNTLTITPALAQDHAAGEVAQPLSVVFLLVGSQLTRCTLTCATAANQIALADLLQAPPGRQLFAAPRTTLSTSANAADTQLCVQSTAGFAVNDQVQVDRDRTSARVATPADRRTITAVGSGGGCPAGQLTLNRGLSAAHAAGSAVRVPAVEINFLASRFNDALQQTQEVTVTSRALIRN